MLDDICNLCGGLVMRLDALRIIGVVGGNSVVCWWLGGVVTGCVVNEVVGRCVDAIERVGVDEIIDISSGWWKGLKCEQLRVIVWLLDFAVIAEPRIAVIVYGVRERLGCSLLCILLAGGS